MYYTNSYNEFRPVNTVEVLILIENQTRFLWKQLIFVILLKVNLVLAVLLDFQSQKLTQSCQMSKFDKKSLKFEIWPRNCQMSKLTDNF